MIILYGFPRRGIVKDKEEFNKFLEKKKKNKIPENFLKECQEVVKSFNEKNRRVLL